MQWASPVSNTSSTDTPLLHPSHHPIGLHHRKLSANMASTVRAQWQATRVWPVTHLEGVDLTHRVTLPNMVCRDAARAELLKRLALKRRHGHLGLHSWFFVYYSHHFARTLLSFCILLSNFIYSCYIFNCFTMTWSSTIKTHHYRHIDSEDELQVAAGEHVCR